MSQRIERILRLAVSVYCWSTFLLIGGIYVLFAFHSLVYAAITGADRLRFVQLGNAIFFSAWRHSLFFSTVDIQNAERFKRARRDFSRLIVVSNHQSLIDMVVIIPFITPFFSFGKEAFGRIPFFGRLMGLGGNLFLRSGDAAGLKIVFDIAKSRIENGETLFLFPEGTRQGGAALNDFKDGAFRLTVETGASLLPMAISGTSDFLQNRSLIVTKLPPYRFVLTVGEPIEPSVHGGDANKLKAMAREQIERMLTATA
ncbi:MAG: 1-acyl-sn-glycerol-3-phosphate acyltransferase [Nitrospinae bacterium]|nr:1-acyl-sn-glycerol-3-phosphate acyltransferase [Nitrospinota bacterium]MBF0634293.1 1-acyl-sn-glycerol-3-phosphate acyltransferase [Nitrospinota bacterium]